MMFGHELIESLHFITPHRPCVQMDENLLFIGCGLAKGGDFFLFHVRQHKKLRPACPAKSFNAFPFSGFPLPKNAPYSPSSFIETTGTPFAQSMEKVRPKLSRFRSSESRKRN